MDQYKPYKKIECNTPVEVNGQVSFEDLEKNRVKEVFHNGHQKQQQKRISS